MITASDGNSISTAFTTAAVNLLLRPGTLAETGSAYSYTSGLVEVTATGTPEPQLFVRLKAIR